MAKVIKTIKEKLDNGQFDSPIPIGANAKNIDMANNKNLEETLGGIDVEGKGTVQGQLNDQKQELENHQKELDNLNTVCSWEEF